MKKTHLGLLAAFVLFVPNVLFALPPAEQAHGITVKFRNASKNTYAKRDQLHKQLGMTLIYRPKRSPYDFVMPKETDQQRDFAQLTKVCETYQAASMVAECDISYDLLTRNKETEAPATTTPPTDACSLNATYENPLLKNGTLTPFWAQELSGADLAAFPKNAARMGVAVRVAVLDQGYGEPPAAFQKKIVTSLLPGKTEGNHGALSLGLLTGPVPFTLQAPLEVTHLFEVRNSADYLKVLDTLEESKSPPSVIVIGVGLGESRAVKEVLTRLSKRSVLVAAAANEWPSESDRNETAFPGVLVGSLTPEGYPSAFSVSGAQVTVSAPSDHFLQSTTNGKMAQNFGGTSAAAAMVGGAVAGARALVQDLTSEEIKTILVKTAIPTAGNTTAGGALNTVAFLAVADRIRSQGLVGPQRTKALAADAGTRLYKFEKEAEMELGKAAPVITKPNAPCEARKMAFAQVRRAFFLQPSGTAQSILVDLYKSQGLNTNARFPENLDKTMLMKNLSEDIAAADTSTRVAAARAAGALGPAGVDLVMKYAETNVRAPASDAGGASISTNATVKAIARQMNAEDKKALGARLKTHGNEELEKLGAEILAP